MDFFRKLGRKLAPPPDQSEEDGRDQWPSRASYILASCGGAVGMGNLLRYPSQVYNNSGLQWFIPYLMAIFFLAIPALALEIAVGNAYRGGCVVAYNNMSKRMKGTGLALNYIGFVVTSYFVPILAWIMHYFRVSFTSSPWEGRAEEYFMDVAVGAVPPDDSGSWVSYPGTGMVGEMTGWNIFLFFVVWLCMFRGVGLTGRVVYFTMGLPIVMTIILIGRGVSLPNAGRGVKMYFGSWDSSKLASSGIWSDAVGQVFFSTGVGFGYYTAYASYNRKFANAVQDACIIVACNASFEALAAFAVFGIVGYLGMTPEATGRVGTYDIGFTTYPEALAQMPASKFFAVVFFFTLILVGISSSFAMLDAVVTLVMDTDWAKKTNRPVVATTIVIITTLVSLPYCTEFGYYYMDGIDRFINNISLIFVVWAECVGSTTVYRFRDVTGQVGLPAFCLFNGGLIGGQILGVGTSYAISPGAGAGIGFGVFFIGLALSLILAKAPDSPGAPEFFRKNVFLEKLFYLAFYSGNQLRNDLNLVIGLGSNWKLPIFWAPLLRYIAGTILAMVISFAYANFGEVNNDPVYILGFFVGHMVVIFVILGFLAPRWFNVFIPAHRLDDGVIGYAPNVNRGMMEATAADSAERGARGVMGSDSSDITEKDKDDDFVGPKKDSTEIR